MIYANKCWRILIVITSFATIDVMAEPIPRPQYLESIAAIYSKATMYNGEVEVSAGSGFVISKKGEILTALHVAGDPSLYESIEIRAYFPKILNGKWSYVGPYEAKINSALREYDLALIQLKDISYSTTVPVMGFNFIQSMSTSDSFEGLGHFLLTDPIQNVPPFQISAKFAGTLPQPPLQIVEESSLNSGASGGPLFKNDDRVAAVWHGTLPSYVGILGEVEVRKGLSLVIPMTKNVRDWLIYNKVTPMESPPEHQRYDFKNGLYEMLVSSDELRPSTPAQVNSRLFMGAPVGTEIIDARIERLISKLHCTSVDGSPLCSTVLVKQREPLEVTSGRVVFMDSKPTVSEKIALTIKASDKSPEINIESISFESFVDLSTNYPKTLARFEAEEGKSVLAASVVFHDGAGGAEAIVKDGTFIVSKIPEKKRGFSGVFYRVFTNKNEMIEAESQLVKGTAIILTGRQNETTEKLAADAITQITSDLSATQSTVQKANVTWTQSIKRYEQEND